MGQGKLDGPGKFHCIIELFNYGWETFSVSFQFSSADNECGMNKLWPNY